MSSREAFEKHVADRMFILTRDEHGAYTSFATHLGWELWKAATERAANACDEIAADRWNLYKGRSPYSGREEGRASSQTQGENLGAEACASAIREGNE